MESFKKFTKDILYPACAICTALCFLFSFLYEILDFDSPFALTLIALIQFFVFSLILSWSNQLFKVKDLSFSLAHFLHYVIFVLNVIASFCFIGQKSNPFGIIVAFSLFYLTSALIALIIRKIAKKNGAGKKDAPYKKQFK